MEEGKKKKKTTKRSRAFAYIDGRNLNVISLEGGKICIASRFFAAANKYSGEKNLIRSCLFKNTLLRLRLMFIV